MHEYACVCACVCVCVYMCVHERVLVCMCALHILTIRGWQATKMKGTKMLKYSIKSTIRPAY
jgi:hypothetical protein